MWTLLLLSGCGADWAPRDEDGDGYSILDGDCWDTEPAVHPGAAEACDGVDQDCDGVVDDGVGAIWYADADGDGFGDPAAPSLTCAQPAGSAPDPTDCDDADATVFPGAAERCDTVDQDCDGDIDDPDAVDQAAWYPDADGDGYGAAAAAVTACEAPAGHVAAGEDCDDADPAYHPGAREDDCADPADYNCDGSSAYDDRDGDGWAACRECDDADPAVRPGADEVCNAVDDDCDATVDEDALDAATWYADADRDGYGDGGATVLACDAPEGHVAIAGDCDDVAATINPAEFERCNAADDNCDGAIDEDAVDAPTWYADADGDGFGDATVTAAACDAPDAHVADATDCDDTAATTHPGADEVCNTADDDCDAVVDEDAVDAPTWHADADGDGHGDPGVSEAGCDAPAGHVADADDCDDTSALALPGGDEVCDSLDNDCDGTVDEAWFTSGFTAAVSAAVLDLNGDARLDAGAVVLTDAAEDEAGTAVYTTPLPADRWYVSFSFTIDDGDGADGGDGLAFFFLDEADTALLGDDGTSLGLYRESAPYTGFAVEVDTYDSGAGDPAEDHVAVMDVETWAYVEAAGVGEVQENGEHTLDVQMEAGDVTVWLDGALVLEATLPDYTMAEVLVGWSAGTGALTNRHAVDDVEIGCPP